MAWLAYVYALAMQRSTQLHIHAISVGKNLTGYQSILRQMGGQLYVERLFQSYWSPYRNHNVEPQGEYIFKVGLKFFLSCTTIYAQHHRLSFFASAYDDLPLGSSVSGTAMTAGLLYCIHFWASHDEQLISRQTAMKEGRAMQCQLNEMLQEL
jgi:hypothetical protein